MKQANKQEEKPSTSLEKTLRNLLFITALVIGVWLIIFDERFRFELELE